MIIERDHDEFVKKFIDVEEDQEQAKEKTSPFPKFKETLNLLVVRLWLSACNTWHGEIKAKGVMGPTRGLFIAGSASTVVSLWSADDGSTALLMPLMYPPPHMATLHCWCNSSSSGSDKSKGKTNKIPITNNKACVLKNDIVHRMVKKAELFKEEDERQRTKVDAKTALENYAFSLNNTNMRDDTRHCVHGAGRPSTDKFVSTTCSYS
jgi:hypothetical protein